MKKHKFIVTAGGTGGHIFPALAIAGKLIESGSEALYVGNRDSIEEQLVSKAQLSEKQNNKLSYTSVNVQKLYRSLTWRHILFPFKLTASILKSASLISHFKPDACIGAGGYVSAPVLIAASFKRIPYYLQEQNSAPGLTTKLLSIRSQKIYAGFAEAKHYLPKRKTIISGNPVPGHHIADDRQDKPAGSVNLLVLGGSQGARTINKAVNDFLPLLYSKYDNLNINLIWQCGRNNYQSLKKTVADTITTAKKLSKKEISFKTSNGDGTSIADLDRTTNSVILFPFTHDMSRLYRQTDIAISRAGAISLAELEINSIPAVIIPISKSAGNHQYLNAKAQVNSGKAVLITEKDLNSSSLLSGVGSLCEKHQEYLNNLRESFHRSAAERIAADIIKDLESTNQNKKTPAKGKKNDGSADV